MRLHPAAYRACYFWHYSASSIACAARRQYQWSSTASCSCCIQWCCQTCVTIPAACLKLDRVLHFGCISIFPTAADSWQTGEALIAAHPDSATMYQQQHDVGWSTSWSHWTDKISGTGIGTCLSSTKIDWQAWPISHGSTSMTACKFSYCIALRHFVQFCAVCISVTSYSSAVFLCLPFCFPILGTAAILLTSLGVHFTFAPVLELCTGGGLATATHPFAPATLNLALAVHLSTRVI